MSRSEHHPYAAAAALLLAVSGYLYAGENEVNEQPELGDVVWERDFEKALSRSRKTGKPILALFQEVPG